jgi:two-component system phosphate regulon response regulator PhoB
MRRRTPQLADEVIEVAGIRLDPGLRRVSIEGREVPLWSTELKLLHFFITHPGRAYTRVKLLDAVWGDNVFVEERTVDVHIRRLRQALSPSGHHKLLETVRGVGYRFVTEPDPQSQSQPQQQIAA